MVACLGWSALFPLTAAPLPRPYTVENYDASIHPDLVSQRLTGEVSIRFHSRLDTAISAMDLDAGGLEITSVKEGQDPQYFERKGALLFVVLTKPLRPDENRTLTVRYQAGPSAGLKFFSDQAYGSITSDWMPSNDRPDERATLRLALTVPPDTKVAASGRLTGVRTGEGESVTEWQLDSPVAPCWFGFALGTFAERTSEAGGVKLRVLGAGTEVFEPTAAALRYLGERSGKPYPGQGYTQVFVHGDVIRAMAGGLTLLPESYSQTGWTKPDSLWLLTSELAHQWYGIRIVSKDWADAWLSEGISAFLADEFLGERLGKAVHDTEVEHSRQIDDQFRAQGKDRPLFYSDWTTYQDAFGEIPTHKGVSFLYLVHDLVGDTAFWKGFRLYTSGQWDQPAASEDLQIVFRNVGGGNRATDKKSSKRRKGDPDPPATPLDKLFDLWVYGVQPTVSKK
jgi:aminopeptidase N